LLDKAALKGEAEGHLFSAIRSIPQTTWQALQQRAGSAAAYALLQRRISDEFRR